MHVTEIWLFSEYVPCVNLDVTNVMLVYLVMYMDVIVQVSMVHTISVYK